jgi:hypothetical protein
MKHILSTLLLVLAVVAPTLAQDWIKVSNTAGRFSLLFPRQPAETEQTIESEAGPLVMKMTMYEVGKYKDDNAVYGIIYTDYPDSLISSEYKDEIVEEFFKGAVEGTTTNIKGTVMDVQKISYGAYPGRRVKISFMDDAAIMHMQVFLVKSRVYILQVGCETAKDGNASIDKFFKSFALLDGKKK